MHEIGLNNLSHSSDAGYHIRFEVLAFSNCLLMIFIIYFFSKTPTSCDLPESRRRVRFGAVWYQQQRLHC